MPRQRDSAGDFLWIRQNRGVAYQSGYIKFIKLIKLSKFIERNFNIAELYPLLVQKKESLRL